MMMDHAEAMPMRDALVFPLVSEMVGVMAMAVPVRIMSAAPPMSAVRIIAQRLDDILMPAAATAAKQRLEQSALGQTFRHIEGHEPSCESDNRGAGGHGSFGMGTQERVAKRGSHAIQTS